MAGRGGAWAWRSLVLAVDLVGKKKKKKKKRMAHTVCAYTGPAEAILSWSGQKGCGTRHAHA